MRRNNMKSKNCKFCGKKAIYHFYKDPKEKILIMSVCVECLPKAMKKLGLKK